MTLSRRQVLLTLGQISLGLSLAGCAATPTVPPHTTRRGRPSPRWPETISDPRSSTRDPVATPDPPSDRAEPSLDTPAEARDGIVVLSRDRWTRRGPRKNHVSAMNGVSRITVHHEGWKPVYFTSREATADRLERIRNSHVNHHGWGDIGYHFIIDRAGRIWQGRPVQYQGAHVRNHNEHNIGVMLLGNFEKQRPAQAQLDSLARALRALMAKYNVPHNHIHTHQELVPTSCPGKHLQPRINNLRQTGALR